MSLSKLKFVSEAVLDRLREQVPQNLERYAHGDFADLEKENGWAIETKGVELDDSLFAELEIDGGDREAEARNSLRVYNGLKGMTPSLAREERIWVRLAHIECLQYGRARWLMGKTKEELEPSVRTHFFARTLTGTRDDHSIGRLWWNGHIANMAAPAEPEKALSFILKTADIRSNFVERTRMVSRPVLAQALVRAMEAEPWITSVEAHFREFMKVVNRNGGGILFEVMKPSETDSFLETCALQAMDHHGQAAV